MKYLRKLALIIWRIKPCKGIVEKIAFPCSHTHTFKYYLPPDTPYYIDGTRKGNIDSLVLDGCYLCGKVKIRDWKR